MKKILKILAIISFMILLYNRVLIYGFNESLAGYIPERVCFFIFIFSALFLEKKSKNKRAIYLAIAFIIITNFTRAFWTGLIYTNYQKKINENLYLTQSTSLESNPVFHITEKNIFTEKNITLLNSIPNNDEEFKDLKKIPKIAIVKKGRLTIILKYDNGGKIKIDTFRITKK